MVENVYMSENGKVYKSKKTAQKHDHLFMLEKKVIDKKDFEKVIQSEDFIQANGQFVRYFVEKYGGDIYHIEPHQFNAFVNNYEFFKSGKVIYHLYINYNERYNKEYKFVAGFEGVENEFPKELKNILKIKEEDFKEKGHLVHKKTEKINKVKFKVFYEFEEFHYTEKLKQNLKLTEYDINDMYWDNPCVLERETGESRWYKNMESVVEVDGDKYCINWCKGLTENQENMFNEQPFKCDIEEETKLIEVTTQVIVKKED